MIVFERDFQQHGVLVVEGSNPSVPTNKTPISFCQVTYFSHGAKSPKRYLKLIFIDFTIN